MKKKILIALIVVMALSVSVLAGCNLDIMSIELKSGTLATQYYVGETVDLSKAKITVAKSDGTTEDIALTQSMLDKQISTAQAGETTYTVTYEGKTFELKITVLAPTIAVKSGTLTTDYYVGDEVNFNGAKIVVTEGQATREVDLTAEMVSPAISTAQAGKTTHTISYNGASTNVEITVNAPSIELVAGSLQLEYLVGDTVSLEGAKIAVTRGNRPVENVNLTQAMLDKEISTSAIGSTEYTVSYNGATAKFTVIVRQVKSIDNVTGIELEPVIGESISLNDAKIGVTYEGAAAEKGQISVTWDMIKKLVEGQEQDVTSIDTSVIGEQKYVVIYGGQRKEFTVNVQDIPVKSIAVSNEFKTVYYDYEGADVPNFKANQLVVTLDRNGQDEVRNMSLETAMSGITLPEKFIADNYSYELNYRGVKTTLTFTVYDVELVVADGFKKDYNVGDEIYVNGKLVNSLVKLIASDANHTVVENNIEVTQSMVKKVFSTDVHGGDKELVIEYKGKSVSVNDIVVNAITISLATGSDAMNTKLVQDSTVNYSGKLVITYQDKTTKLIDLEKSMFSPEISTSALGKQTYIIRYKDAETSVTIKVVPSEEDKVAFTTWNVPQFIQDYISKNGSINNGNPLDGENTNFRQSAVYEVGNANKFLFTPIASNNGPSLDSEIWTNVKFEVKGDNGVYTELTGEDLNNFVTIENNAYLFSQTAAGKTVRITVWADEDYHVVPDTLTNLSLEFVVVENGYNVYNQDGLAVMTDLIRPEIWAEILGCSVDSNGSYGYLPDASKALKLPADTEPLFKYIGNVDWIILHGSIEIDPDKLPDAYFWNDENAEDYKAAIGTLTGAATGEARKAMLKGSLKDWAPPAVNDKGEVIGYGGNYMICKDNVDDNNNKGLYCTTRINVSGNLGSIRLLEGRSEGGRILESVVFRHTHESDRQNEIGPQWHLFKMFEERKNYENPLKEFTVKNVSLKGNTSLSGTDAANADGTGRGNVSGGIAMINFASKNAYAVNVLAEGFNVNFSGDNYFGGNIMDLELDSCRMVDSFSAAIFGWRVRSSVKKSYLADFGGPVFIISDGDRVKGNDSPAPTVTLDKESYAEAYATGTEPWYAALDSSVPLMFGMLKMVDMQLQANAGLTFFHTDSNNNSRADVIAIMIPETGSVFSDQSSKPDDEKIEIKGSYTHVKSDSVTVNATMSDQVFQTIRTVADTLIISSGPNYAYVSSQSQTGVELSLPRHPDSSNPINQISWDTWKLAHTDTLTIWMQAQTGASPYIGVVVGNLTKVGA